MILYAASDYDDNNRNMENTESWYIIQNQVIWVMAEQ